MKLSGQIIELNMAPVGASSAVESLQAVLGWQVNSAIFGQVKSESKCRWSNTL